MHEVGLVEGVIEILRRSIAEQGLCRVTRVRLVVGKLTAARPEALSFAFEVLSGEEPWLKGALLEIEERELTADCRRCGERQILHDCRLVCTNCGGHDLQVVEGRELLVDFYEGE